MPVPAVAITKMAATLQRVDLPCALLGLPPPPAQADLKLARAGFGWTLQLTCASLHSEAFHRWLGRLGAADVVRGPLREPHAIRARFRELPPPLQTAATTATIEHLIITAEGTASLIVRSREDEALRLSQRLDGVKPTEAPPPALTKRQSELLLYCISHGYYNIPRRATLRTLSSQLGISTTSLSLALRRAEGKIILAYASRLPRPVDEGVHLTERDVAT